MAVNVSFSKTRENARALSTKQLIERISESLLVITGGGGGSGEYANKISLCRRRTNGFQRRLYVHILPTVSEYLLNTK